MADNTKISREERVYNTVVLLLSLCFFGGVVYEVYEGRSEEKEVIFHERNYQHLTGLELVDKNGNVLCNQSKNFFRKCIENKLGLEEFRFKQDGTTQLKLAALPMLLDVSKMTKITGDYNNIRPYLYVDKVMGGVNKRDDLFGQLCIPRKMVCLKKTST